MTWPEIFVVGFTVAVVADLILVWTGRKSISLRTWIQTQAHPTLIAAGVLAWVGGAYLLSDSVAAVGLWCGVGGHLWVHE